MSEPHPEFREEQAFLNRTVEAIDQAFEDLKGRYYESATSNFGNRMLNLTIRADTLEQLEEYGYRPPYFGRLDFSGERGEEQVYFGFAHLPLPHGRILDWRCDLYSLYVGTNTRKQQYKVKATGRTHQVDLLLKRRFEIKERQLLNITDQVDRRQIIQSEAESSVIEQLPVPPTAVQEQRSLPEAFAPHNESQEVEVELEEDLTTDDAFLIRQLYSRGDPRLQDIVETIQLQQDVIIRLPLDELLVLHGVAGSGKTSIAYHRLAYLMYPEHGYNLEPKQVLIIGPNRTFLTYVRDLLPSLGVSNIAQRTFQDWAWSRMRLRNKAIPASPEFRDTVETLLEEAGITDADREVACAVASLKGSLRFRTLVERYAQQLLDAPPLPTETITIPGKLENRSIQIPLSVAEIRAMWEESRGKGSLDEQRDRFLRRVARYPGQWFRTVFGEPNSNDKAFILQMSKAVRDRLGRLWGRPNLLRLYEAMFTADSLHQLGQDLFTEQELQMLTREPLPTPPRSKDKRKRPDVEDEEQEEAKAERTPVELVDVAGLFLLNEALYGNQPAQYRHVVLDEAQDFSPLQFQLLLEACPTRSMTIVGDTAQGIYAYRGIDDWSELADVLPPDEVRRELISQNYRSTREIVAFTNAVQQAVRGERALNSEAINRTGPRPQMAAFDTLAQFQRALLASILQTQQRGFKNIAIIASNERASQGIGDLLTEHGIQHQRISRNHDTTPAQLTGIVSIPASLTKGLEFEAVIVVDASESTYPSHSQHAGKLLYVAVSRALHWLQVLSFGPFSTWLDQATPHAEVTAKARILPSQDNIERTRQALQRSLREGIVTMRAGRVPLRYVLSEICQVAEHSLEEGKVAEVLDAYLTVGQFASYSANDLLYRLFEAQDYNGFLHYALAFGAPAWLDEEVDQAISQVALAEPEVAESLNLRFEEKRQSSISLSE